MPCSSCANCKCGTGSQPLRRPKGGRAEKFGAKITAMYVAEESDALLSLDLQQEFASWLDPLVREHTEYRKVIVHGDAAARVLEVANHIGADATIVGAQH